MSSEITSEMLPRTLYVGNLHPEVTEDLICTLFNSIGMGNVIGCKIIFDPGNDPYCFVEFSDHQAAAQALLAMNKRLLMSKELKVNWATSPGHAPKQDTSKHHHIFVGDLSPEIETPLLREAFQPFGEISDCRVVRDPQTCKSKGYGFVSFVRRPDAENAINTMNGQWLGNRAIRTNWATRKPPSTQRQSEPTEKTLTYDEVFKLASPTNCTVYCGGISGLPEDTIKNLFEPFGNIKEIRVFKDKGYSFIRYDNKESATQAIVSLNNKEINGQFVKCSWGKESKESNSQSQPQSSSTTYNGSNISTPLNYPYPSYWYSSGYQIPSHYMQYPYGQYGIVSMPWPNATANSAYQQQPSSSPNYGMDGYPLQSYQSP